MTTQFQAWLAALTTVILMLFSVSASNSQQFEIPTRDADILQLFEWLPEAHQLDLVDTQRRDIRGLRSVNRWSMGRYGAPQVSGRDAYDRLAEILLPHQREVLHQLYFRQLMDRSPLYGGLLDRSVVEWLGFTEEQQQAIKKRAEETKEMGEQIEDEIQRLQRRIAELQAQVDDAKDRRRRQLLRDVTPEQRELFDQLTGRGQESR